jgi:hypothetical protein
MPERLFFSLCFRVLATLFVVINLVGQLGSVAMVLTRFKVDIACCVLFFIVVLQVAGYDISSKSQLQETTIHAHTRANPQTLTPAQT